MLRFGLRSLAMVQRKPRGSLPTPLGIGEPRGDRLLSARNESLLRQLVVPNHSSAVTDFVSVRSDVQWLLG